MLSNEAKRWISDDGEIRITPDGQPSVFDMIKILGGQKNPTAVWVRLVSSHPEVATKTSYFQFHGQGQRPTPVAKDKEAAFYIIGLLPGMVGRKYREHSAKLLVKWLENPAGLVGDLAEQLEEDQQKRLEARFRGKRTRHKYTDVLKERGVQKHGYGRCTNAIYEPMLGASARGMKTRIAEREGLVVSKIKNVRDHMTLDELTDIEFAENVAEAQIRRHDIYGNYGCEHASRKSAEHVKKLRDGEIDIPGIA